MIFFFFFRFLTTSNLTTNEDIKGAYSNKRTHTNFNPFSAGNAILNCSEVICGPTNPSLIDARGYVTEDYLVAMSTASIATSPNQQQLGPGSPLPAVAASVNTKYPQRVIISSQKMCNFFRRWKQICREIRAKFLVFSSTGLPKANLGIWSQSYRGIL